VQPAPC